MLRNKLKYLLMLAIVGVLSILYNRYYMSIIFLTVLALPFLMFGLLSYIYGRVRADLISSAHIVGKGEAIPISVQISNPTIFPISKLKIYLVYRNSYSGEKYTKEFTVSVDSRTKAVVTCNLFSDYAGNLSVVLKAIRIYDYLKLFSFKKKLKGEVRAAVLPNYYELLENNLISQSAKAVESDNFSPHKSGDDPSEVFAIREYRAGDRQSRIHWKLSRKQGQLMIKEFSEPMNCSVLLLVDLFTLRMDNVLFHLDSILECALSLSYTFFMQGQLHYFAWYDVKHGGIRRIRVGDEKDLFEAVDGLLQAAPYQDKEDTVSAYLAEHPNEQYTDLYYVTGEASLNNLDLLSCLKSQSRQMIYISDTENLSDMPDKFPEVIQTLGELGIGLWPVEITNVKRDMEQIRLY